MININEHRYLFQQKKRGRYFKPISFILFLLLPLTGLSHYSFAQTTDNLSNDIIWENTVDTARGQKIYFSAWSGDPRINRYIRWASQELKRQYDIDLIHAKSSDIANTITALIAEKSAGRTQNGRVDLVWINGENFHSLKQTGLLYGPFAQQLPNYQFIDIKGKPATVVDFTVPTQGFEMPWGLAQLTFLHDSQTLPNPPKSINALLLWAEKNPGRFTYPLPPDFLGTTFLKQVLLELHTDHSVFQQAPSDQEFSRVTQPLWQFLDRLHPNLWRSGRVFAANAPALRQLMSDSELDLAFSFSPADAISAVSQGLLPASVKGYFLSAGTISNAHFIAIPYNSGSKSAAMVAANFFLSPKAQAYKADPTIWGDTSVLAIDQLPSAQQQLFKTLPQTVMDSTPTNKTLNEPHPAWTVKLEKEWLLRYGR